MFRKKILVIEDTELMTRMITDILSSVGYDVVSATNGLDGLKMVVEEKPNIVLLDIVMPGMDGFEVCKTLREDVSNNLIPIIMLTSQDKEDDKLTGLELGADDYIIKPFNPRELISRVNNTLLRIERNRYANPLTGLQGNIEIQLEMNHRIAKKEMFAVLYLDIDNFKVYNDVYGFAYADRAIKLTAEIIKENVHQFGTPRDFIGHIGGDDFIAITIPECINEICEGIINDFDEKIKTLYSKADNKRRYIITKNRQGVQMKFPIMTISIAVVTNEKRVLQNHIHIAEVTAEVKKKAKSIQGSVYVKDNRRSGG